MDEKQKRKFFLDILEFSRDSGCSNRDFVYFVNTHIKTPIFNEATDDFCVRFVANLCIQEESDLWSHFLRTTRGLKFKKDTHLHLKVWEEILNENNNEYGLKQDPHRDVHVDPNQILTPTEYEESCLLLTSSIKMMQQFELKLDAFEAVRRLLNASSSKNCNYIEPMKELYKLVDYPLSTLFFSLEEKDWLVSRLLGSHYKNNYQAVNLLMPPILNSDHCVSLPRAKEYFVSAIYYHFNAEEVILYTDVFKHWMTKMSLVAQSELSEHIQVLLNFCDDKPSTHVMSKIEELLLIIQINIKENMKMNSETILDKPLSCENKRNSLVL